MHKLNIVHYTRYKSPKSSRLQCCGFLFAIFPPVLFLFSDFSITPLNSAKSSPAQGPGSAKPSPVRNVQVSGKEKSLKLVPVFFRYLSFISFIIGRAFLFLFLRKRKKRLVKLLFFFLLYPGPGSGSTDPNECGSDRIRIHITANMGHMLSLSLKIFEGIFRY